MRQRAALFAAPARRMIMVHAAADADPPTATTSTSSTTSTSAAPARDPRFKGLKVFVAGAAGGTGKAVVEALRAKGVPVRALVRDAAAAAAKLPAAGDGLEIVEGDVAKYTTLLPAMGDSNAVVVATGARDPRDPLGPLSVDFNGTLNLIEAAKRAGATRFVLVTSIGADDLVNPLNLFWGVLLWKKQAELALARSGLEFTVVRPGGLKSALRQGETSPGSVVMAGAGTYGFPPLKKSGSILRSQVADVCVEALVAPGAINKVVEVISETSAAPQPLEQLFESIPL